jgi:NTE family protein
MIARLPMDERRLPEAAVLSTPRQINGASIPGRIVLVMQGGGAPGCYQARAYQALHESGIEPDWVIGTSIGAINGAIIAGNPLSDRVGKLKQFWDRWMRAFRNHGAN